MTATQFVNNESKKGFYALLKDVVELLKKEEKVSYDALKREFDIDDETIEDIKIELIEVKKMALDENNKILVLSPTYRQSNTEKLEARNTHFKQMGQEDQGDAFKATNSKTSSKKDHREEKIKSGASNPHSLRKNIWIWLGVAFALIGVLMPWVSVSVQLPNNQLFSSSASGLKVSQGLLSLGVGFLGALAGFISDKKKMPFRLFELLVLITGIVIVGVAMDALEGVNTNDLGFYSATRIKQNAESGVYITMIGGILLTLGGLKSLVRKKKSDE